MSENIVKIIVETDASGAVIGLKQVNDEAGDKAPKAAVKGAAGFRALGMASSKLAEELGVPFRASHALGTKVEQLAKSTFPAWGMALGAAGIAITAVVVGIGLFTERQKEMSEALDKSIASLRGEVDALYQFVPKSEEASRASYNLLVWKKEHLKVDLAKKIREETEELGKQNEKLKGFQEAPKMYAYATYDEKLRDMTIAAGELGAQLKADQEYLQTLLTTPSFENTLGPMEDASAYYAAQHAAAWDEYVQTRLEVQSALYKANQDWLEDSRKTRVTDYNEMLDVMKRRSVYVDQQRADEKRKDQIQMQNKVAVASWGANALEQIYQLSHQRYKIFFYASRAAAAAEAIIQGYLGAAKAEGTFWGMPMGPVLIGMGYANADLILAQSFEGGSGGGGGAAATPVFNANPTTGQPEYKYYSYEQSTYGSGWRPGEGPSGGDTYHVYGDVYAQDSDSFKKKVNQAVQQDIKDRGQTAKTIQRYT